MLAALLIATVAAVIDSGVRSGMAQRRSADGDPAGPFDRQQALLARLADLEFEYQTGKIGDEEYRELKAPLAKAALEARAEVEAAGSHAGADRGGDADEPS